MNLSGGTVSLTMTLQEPWPPGMRTALHEHQMDDGRLVFSTSPIGALIFTLLEEGNHQPIDEIVTSPLILGEGRTVKVAATWRNREMEAVACNGSFVFHRHESDAVVGSLIIEKRQRKAQADFTGQNEAARTKRREKAAGWQSKPERVSGGESYLLAALDDERRQLYDLVSLVRQGSEHHLPGIASRIRLLVTGSPLGLLQHVAAFLDMPLMFFTEDDPFEPRPAEPLYGLSLVGSLTPNDFCANPIDLDVWLGLPALVVAYKALSTLQLVKVIGDTIGSHRDVDIAHSVAAMTRRPSLSGNRYNDIGSFLLRASVILIGLCDQVLTTHQSRDSKSNSAGPTA